MAALKNKFCTSQAAYAVNDKGRIIAWNEAAERVFGYTPSQALNRSCWELLQGQDVFGNTYCGQSCPIRSAAIRCDVVNLFQLDFMTAAGKRERFTLTTVTLLDDPGARTMVNLCQPASEPGKQHATKLSNEGDRHDRLTPRQTEVLYMLSEGKSGADIAAKLGISVFTVRNHTQHVLFKLKAQTRLEAVAVGRKLGLI